MQRVIAALPESVHELCLVRLGLQARRWSAILYARRLARSIERESACAKSENAGLLHSEKVSWSLRHFGFWQYWSSFEAMEAWSHRAPHSDWWREVVERGRTRTDLGVYHETFLVPRDNFESIYLDCEPTGVATFGTRGEPVGRLTTSRDRLGRRDSKPA